MPICNKKTEVINKISEVVVNKFNSELSNNFVLNNLKRELKEKDNEINSILNAIEQGIVTKSTKERLTKIETTK